MTPPWWTVESEINSWLAWGGVRNICQLKQHPFKQEKGEGGEKGDWRECQDGGGGREESWVEYGTTCILSKIVKVKQAHSRWQMIC